MFKWFHTFKNEAENVTIMKIPVMLFKMKSTPAQMNGLKKACDFNIVSRPQKLRLDLEEGSLASFSIIACNSFSLKQHSFPL